MLRAGGTTPELVVLGAATCVLHLGDYLGDLRPQGPIGELGPSQLRPAGRKGVRVGVGQSTGLLPFFAEVWPLPSQVGSQWCPCGTWLYYRLKRYIYPDKVSLLKNTATSNKSNHVLTTSASGWLVFRLWVTLPSILIVHCKESYSS